MRDSRIGVFGALGLVLCLLMPARPCSGTPAAARGPDPAACSGGRPTHAAARRPRVRPATPGQGLAQPSSPRSLAPPDPLWLAVLLVLAGSCSGPGGGDGGGGSGRRGRRGRRSRAAPRRTDRRRAGGGRGAVRAGLARPRAACAHRNLSDAASRTRRPPCTSCATAAWSARRPGASSDTWMFPCHRSASGRSPPLPPACPQRPRRGVLERSRPDPSERRDHRRTPWPGAHRAVRAAGVRDGAMGRPHGRGDQGARRRRALDVDGRRRPAISFPTARISRSFRARAWPAFEEIVAAHPGGALAIVAHGGTNRVLLCRALGVAPERILALGQDYAALSVLVWSRDRFTLARLNHQVALSGPSD